MSISKFIHCIPQPVISIEHIRWKMVSILALLVALIPLAGTSVDHPVETSSFEAVFSGVVEPSSFIVPSLIVEESASPAIWGELSYTLNQEQQKQGMMSLGATTIEMFGVNLAPSGEQSFVSAVIPDISYKPRSSGKTTLKFSKDRLQSLKTAGLPDDVVAGLEDLEEQEFADETLFWDAVEQRIGKEGIEKYRQSIIESAGSGNASTISAAGEGQAISWQATTQAKATKQAWDSIFYYPKTIQETLGVKSQQAGRTAVVYDEEDKTFDLLRFFKEWGIPTPLAVVLLGLAIYTILAFLARN